MQRLNITRLDALDYATSEALNTLATNLSFAGPDVRVIMMTSCQPQEGKSFITMNLARTLAGIGKSVALVDADLRRSELVGRHRITSEGRIIGLAHYLANLCVMSQILYETSVPNLYMIPAGRDVANSLSLLNGTRLSNLFRSLRKSFDVILVDAPPVGIIIDAAEIAKSCDGVMFVVSSNAVTRRELTDAMGQIEKTGCRVLGATLNKIRLDTHSARKRYAKTYYNHYNASPKSQRGGEPAPQRLVSKPVYVGAEKRPSESTMPQPKAPKRPPKQTPPRKQNPNRANPPRRKR